MTAMRYRLTFVIGLALGYVLGTRAGRERYEQLKKSARQVAQNPAVRNTAETAAQQSRVLAGKAAHVVGEKIGEHMPDSLTQRVHALRDRHPNGEVSDDWGVSNT
ncbi:YtxH domain-containing protein [Streptomyces sp. NPDC086787]|uniref:YtxH domain-containing protein n=1 Tax=Streptomyces sp. NPDC086787 TaxID=3365759 RepID=UPI0038106B04